MYTQSTNSKKLVIDDRFIEPIEQFLENKYQTSDFHSLLQKTSLHDVITLHEAVIGLRKILCQDNPPIQMAIDSGLVEKFFTYVKQTEYPQIQLEAAWALTNIASGTTEQCESIVKNGGIPLFLEMLKSPYLGIIEQAAWAIGNISSDCTIYRNQIIDLGGIQVLIQVIQNVIKQQKLVQICAWALSNFCRGLPLPKYQQTKDAIKVLCDLIAHGLVKKKDTLIDMCWAITYATEPQQGKTQVAANLDFIVQMVSFLSDDNVPLVIPTMRIIGNITTLNGNQVDIIINANGVNQLYAALHHHNVVVRREALWVISNIVAGSQYHVILVFNFQVDLFLCNMSMMQKILEIFESDKEDVRKEICYIFMNFSHLGEKTRVLEFFLNSSALRGFKYLLKGQYKTVSAALECLEPILKLGQYLPNYDENPIALQLVQMNIIEDLVGISNNTSGYPQEQSIKLLKIYFPDQDKGPSQLNQAFESKLKIDEE